MILPPPGQPDEYLDKLAEYGAAEAPWRRRKMSPTAIVYLVTSAFCTGNIIYVDGGRHLKEHVNGRSYLH